MGKCSICGKEILYNKYKMYRGKVLCQECYSTRLERKKAAKAERKRQAELVKIVKPTKRAKKSMRKKGLTEDFTADFDGHALDIKDVDKNEEEKTAEDSS